MANEAASERITVVENGLDQADQIYYPIKKWDRVSVMCLLEIIWEKYDEAKDGYVPQNVIFEGIAKEMRNNGYNVSSQDVRKKYSNLNCTYRRIVAKGGRNELKWPYYEIMREIRKKERECRVKDENYASQDEHIRDSSSPLYNAVSEDIYANADLDPQITNNLSTLSAGVAINRPEDCLTFANQLEAKSLGLEEYKMQLLGTIFKSVKQQRTEVEEDAAHHIKLIGAKNKQLMLITSEMTQMRVEIKKELTALSESINDLIAALRATSAPAI